MQNSSVFVAGVLLGSGHWCQLSAVLAALGCQVFILGCPACQLSPLTELTIWLPCMALITDFLVLINFAVLDLVAVHFASLTAFKNLFLYFLSEFTN